MKIFKRFMATILLPALCLNIFSCGFSNNKTFNRYDEKNFINDYIKLFTECIESGDAISLKSRFSSQIIIEIPEIDDSIKIMLNFIGIGDTSYEFYSTITSPWTSTSKEDGQIVKKLRMPFIICTGDKKYRVAMEIIQYDSFSEINVGITSIYIVEDELFSEVCGSEYVYWGGGYFNPGITIDNEETLYRG